MATLDAKKRASLPNSAFAYVDSKGNRRLPIHDAAHVRNALARFNQVKFESEEARERAFRRLLKAASEHGIAPVGFVARRLQEARAAAGAQTLPSGKVTLMLSDIEGSTRLVRALGDEYAALLGEVREVIRAAVGRFGGYEVDARADEFFAAFAAPAEGLQAAIDILRALEGRARGGLPVRVRIGLHSGTPALTDTGYVGLPVHVAARVCSAGHGGQILVSAGFREDVQGSIPEGVGLTSLGSFLLQGLAEAEELFQVTGPGLETTFPPPRVPKG